MTSQDKTIKNSNEDNSKGKPEEKLVIHIDKKKYRVDTATLTGAQIRALPEPDIAADYLLKQQIPGGDDKTIENDQAVQLKNGMHFFSIPKNINPGSQ